MKRLLITSLAMILMVAHAWSQGAQAELVKQKAMAIRDNNNQQQGITPAAAPINQYQPPTASPVPTPGMSPAQLQLINRLITDFSGVKLAAPISPAQKTTMMTDLLALSKVAEKPTKETLDKLSNDIASALSERLVPPQTLARLGRDINIVLNCNLLTQARAQTFVLDAQTILKSSSVSDATADLVATDLTGIVTQIQKNKARLYQ